MSWLTVFILFFTLGDFREKLSMKACKQGNKEETQLKTTSAREKNKREKKKKVIFKINQSPNISLSGERCLINFIGLSIWP